MTFMAVTQVFKSCLLLLTVLMVCPVQAVVKTYVDLRSSLPATDLCEEGRPLGLLQLQTLKEQGKDLASYIPCEGAIWKEKINPPAPHRALKDNYEFVSTIPSSLGEFWFSVQDLDRKSERFEVAVGRKAFTILLRNELLRRLGYKVEEYTRLPRLTVQFGSGLEKDLFMDSMKEGMDVDDFEQRWVVDKSHNTSLILQDVLITPSQTEGQRLALGVDGKSIRGRRALNALLAPYSLTEIHESINILPWKLGEREGHFIALDYRWPEDFAGATIADIKWATLRMARLKREDWHAIVQKTQLPPEVMMLLEEKLVSRRNSLVKLMGLPIESLAVDYQISSPPRLDKGKLLAEAKNKKERSKDFWPGYGSRFIFGDFEDPFSLKEIGAYFKELGKSSILDNLISTFNSKVLFHTDVNAFINRGREDNMHKDLIEGLESGKPLSPRFGSVKVPWFGTDLVLSRDVILGGYMGTDNQLQVADSFGLNLAGGIHLDISKMGSPYQFSAGAKGRLGRIYSHLRPINSISAVKKLPVKDVIVPLFNNRILSKLDSFMRRRSEDLKQEEIEDFLIQFNQILATGESIIVTDTLDMSMDGSVGYGMAPEVNVGGQISGGTLVLSRIHILRVNEKTVQIYQDLGNVNTLSLGLGLYTFNVPALTVGWNIGKGTAQTKLHTLNLDPKQDLEELRGSLRNLYSAIKYNYTRHLRRSAPVTFKHHFNDGSTDVNLLFWRFSARKTDARITVKNAKGDSKSYYRRVHGSRFGKNYEQVFFDIANAILQTQLEGEEFVPHLTRKGNADPADSFKGSSVTRKVGFEAETEEVNAPTPRFPGESVVTLDYNWKGFNQKRESTQKIIASIHKYLGQDIYRDNSLNSTEKILFYDIHLGMRLSDEGTRDLMKLSRERFIALIRSNGRHLDREVLHAGRAPQESEAGRIFRLGQTFERYQRRMNKAVAENDVKGFGVWASEIFSLLENSLNFKAMQQLIGKDKLYIESTISGLRYGDENGAEKNLMGDTIGAREGKYPQGPLGQLMEMTDISSSELLLHWLLGRI